MTVRMRPVKTDDACQALIEDGDRRFAAGDVTAAISKYMRAAEAAPAPRVRALALKNAAICDRRLGNTSDALAKARSAAAITASNGADPRLSGEISLLVGNCLTDQHVFKEGAESIADAAALLEEAGRHQDVIQAQIDLARNLAEAGDTEKATALFEFLEHQTLPKLLRSQVVNNLGLLYGRMGRHEAAARLFTQDVGLSQELGDAYGEAVARANLGGALRELGDRENARTELEAALGLLREIGATRDAARVERSLG
jgi:tetratricopeptide (TPR) repeat protein